MADVRRIASPSEIPAGERYALVMYGREKKDTRHSRGITITIEEGERDPHKKVEFLTAVGAAKVQARREGISTVYVVDPDFP